LLFAFAFAWNNFWVDELTEKKWGKKNPTKYGVDVD
jgi:hypothetical protein